MRVRDKWLIALSLAAFMAFYLVGMGLPVGPLRIGVKAAAVGLLAVLAFMQGSKPLAAIMALGALGDAAIELDLIAGATAFLVGHLVAIRFYLQHRRAGLTHSQRALAGALIVGIPVIAWTLPSDRSMAPVTALYALALAGMAAVAWTSRFSRYSVGIGAMLFVASDLLIFSRSGPLAQSRLPDLLIWPLYYYGQYLICLGVLRRLQAEGTTTAPPLSRASGA